MLNNLELRVSHLGRPSLSKGEIRKIINSYSTFNGNAVETARQLVYSRNTIIKYWSEEGLKPLGDVNRRYRGFKTPLHFFRANKEYMHLTRSGLSQKDPGLYRTLLRHGQLKKAIPETRKGYSTGRPPLNEQKVNLIVESYERFDGNAIKTAEFLGLSTTTIVNYWRKNGLERRKSHDSLSQEKIDEIVRVYAETGTINRTANLTGHECSTVSKYLRLHGKRL